MHLECGHSTKEQTFQGCLSIFLPNIEEESDNPARSHKHQRKKSGGHSTVSTTYSCNQDRQVSRTNLQTDIQTALLLQVISSAKTD